MDVSVCVINHQGAEYLAETLDTIERMEGPVGQVIVVDDASTDGSDSIAAARAGVELVRLDRNRGPGVARNAGFEAAKHRHVLFLDNDVLPEPGCARTLTAELRRAGATIAVPRILYYERPEIIQYDGASAHFIGLMRFRNADRPAASESERTEDIQTLMTACFLLDRARWGDGPPFDELFFYLFEDHDFGLRARIAGHRVIVVPAARCLHRAGTPGLSLRREGDYTPVRLANLFRNRWLILARTYRLRTIALLVPPFVLFELFQLAGAVRKGWLGHWSASAGWMIRRSLEILRSRRRTQAGRIVGDGEILTGGPLPFSSRLLGDGIEARAGRVLDRFARGWWRVVSRWV